MKKDSIQTFVILLIISLVCSATLHPAYEDIQTENEERCDWCTRLIEPAVKAAVLNSVSTDNTKDSTEAALRSVILASESDEEFEMIREEVEAVRWDTSRMRQLSALQRFYHMYPSYRGYFDKLIEHTVCACKPLEVSPNDRVMQRVLELHSQAVRKEYAVHGYPEGMEAPTRHRSLSRSQGDL